MRKLEIWSDYTREEVHAIFSPNTRFTPQAGTWGLRGSVRIPDRAGDWVFFVTFGKSQGEHVFDESVTPDGVLSWQSRPEQRLGDDMVREFILHDDRVNNIHLFLRTDRGEYSYLGRLGYLTHDSQREKPVYFQWQILSWPPPSEFLERIGLNLLPTAIDVESDAADVLTSTITVVDPPSREVARVGVTTREFRQHKTPDYAAQDQRNRQLGRQGEVSVLEYERKRLCDGGRGDLAQQVTHVSDIEGDGAGYDIRSFELDGRVRFIEVKTTKGGAATSFFLSANEVAFSERHADSYVLYRLFDYGSSERPPRMFKLSGDIRGAVSLSAAVYRAEMIALE